MTATTAAERPRKERKENAEMRRSQLLEATRRSIVANGLSKTTLATVAAEAGLSQGVAVFYFKSKMGLLTETLRDHYLRYENSWKKRLADAGEDPLDQLLAIIRADFDPAICDSDSLALWFAFWGEEKFTPQYAGVTLEFDLKRRKAIGSVCAALVEEDPSLSGDEISDWIDTLTDGYWQRLHLSSKDMSAEMAEKATLNFVAQLLPRHAERIRPK